MAYIPVKMGEAKEQDAPFFIEMYVLNLKTGTSYIAACDEDITFNGHTYLAVPFSRDDITRSGDNLFDETQVQIGDVDDTKLAYILSGFDFRGCKAMLFKIQYPDSLSDPNLILPVFVGYLDSPSYSSGVFSCKLKSFFPELNTPTRMFQFQCNSNFGDANCGMSLEGTSAHITGVSENKLILDKKFDDEYFQFGTANIRGETRNILDSTGDTITLGINFLQSNLIGKSITLTRGCDKTKECCARYGNRKHFSGFPAVPFEKTYI